MPREIELPDGTIAEFPDDMGDDEIAGVLSKQFPAEPEKPKLAFPEKKPRPQYAPERLGWLQRIMSAVPASLQGFSTERLQKAPEDLKNLGIGAAKGTGQLAAGAGEVVRHVGQKQEELLPGSSRVIPFSPGAYAEMGNEVSRLTGNEPPPEPSDQSLSERIKSTDTALGLNPEGTAQEIGAGLAKAAPALVGTGGASLPLAMAGSAAQMAGLSTLEGATPGEALGAGAAGAAGPLLAKGAEAVGGRLAGKAVEQYRKALNPTTRATKQEAEKIIPELLQRGVSGNLEDLAAKGAEESAAVGKKLAGEYGAASAAGKRLNADAIIADLEKLKQPFAGEAANPMAAAAATRGNPALVPLAQQGKVPINEPAIQAITDLQESLRTLKPDPENLWKFRKNLDNIVRQSNGFARPLPPHVRASIARNAREVLQRELNKAVPNVEELNKQYQLWEGLQHVARESSLRKVGQQGAPGMLARAGGVAAGSAIGAATGGIGGGIAGAVAGQQVAKAISSAVASPAWRTVSAVQKRRLAGLLADGKTQEAVAFLTKVIGQQVAGPRDYGADVERARRRRQLSIR